MTDVGVIIIVAFFMLFGLVGAVVVFFACLRIARSKNPVSPILQELLLPLGFRCKRFGGLGKWSGKIDACPVVIKDLPTIPGASWGGAFSIRTKASKGYLRVEVGFPGGAQAHIPNKLSGKEAKGKALIVSSTNVEKLNTNDEIRNLFRGLLAPPAISPLGISSTGLSINFSSNVSLPQLKRILNELVFVANGFAE